MTVGEPFTNLCVSDEFSLLPLASLDPTDFAGVPLPGEGGGDGGGEGGGEEGGDGGVGAGAAYEGESGGEGGLA